MDALLPGHPVGAFLRREQGLWRDRFDQYPYDFVVITILSLIVYRWAIASRIDEPDLKEAAKVNEDVVIDEQ